MKTSILILSFVWLCFACSSRQISVKNLDQKASSYQFGLEATKRNAWAIVDQNGNLSKILAEVQPDVALSTTVEFLGKIKNGQSTTAEANAKIVESIAKLGERTAAVNILRDALYRMEEHCFNFPNHCDSSSYWTRFDAVMKRVTDMSKAQSAKSKAEAVESINQLNANDTVKLQSINSLFEGLD